MDCEYIRDRVPEKLVERLESRRDERRFRRRVVLAKEGGRWQLVCCTVEDLVPGLPVPPPTAARRYPQAILSEDFLTGAECLAFANEIHRRRAVFGEDIELLRTQNTQWSVHIVPVNNDHMIRAGHVISVNLAHRRERSAATMLLTPEAPYYPDIESAARDWLPFTRYHGEADARNDHIVFLLPEIRAFVADAVVSDHGTIDIIVDGSEAHALPLLIKGAYWRANAIHHLDVTVSECKATLSVPADADRLEYYLIDSSGKVYDFHREDRHSRLDPDHTKLRLQQRTLAEQVRQACTIDEGRHIEFKPFIAPEQSLGTPTQKTKLREVVATAVAFANTEGGKLYLGIEDDCTITGVNSGLQSWIKGAVDDSAINKYLSALKSRIKESVSGDVVLQLAHARVGDAIVVVIEVPKAAKQPVSIHDDHYLYVRIGHRTRKLPPDQWARFLMPDRSLDALMRGVSA